MNYQPGFQLLNQIAAEELGPRLPHLPRRINKLARIKRLKKRHPELLLKECKKIVEEKLTTNQTQTDAREN